MERNRSHSNHDGNFRLTPRELRVLELIAKQFSQADIGTILGVEAKALDALINRIVIKMDARSPSDAAIKALMAAVMGPRH